MKNYLEVLRGEVKSKRLNGESTLDLQTFIGELERKSGKEASKEDASTLARAALKAIEKSNEHLQAMGFDNQTCATTEYVEFLQGFVIKGLSLEEIEAFFADAVLTMDKPNIGKLMAALKKVHGSNFDGKEASAVAKKVLS